MTRRPLLLGTLLGLPLVGFAVLLALPALDVRWQHDPIHFWIVLLVALANVALGAATSEAARLRGDARLFFVSLALLSSAAFFALHALATPGVLTSGPNAGFFVATPVGLLLASAFAAVSATDLQGEEVLRRWQRPLRLGLLAVVLAWAAWSLAERPPLDAAPPDEAPIWLVVLLPFGIGAYGFAAFRYARIYRERRRELPLAVAVAFVLLAEALIAVAFSRSWHVSWWQWHVLLAISFGAIVIAARREFRSARSFAEAFGGLYLARTLERLDLRQSVALGELAAAAGRGEDTRAAAQRLQAEGFTGDELAVLERSARELSRVDGLLRRYVGPQLAERLSADPAFQRLGGTEREVTALFADLVDFTPFTERHAAPEVVAMLNAYWEHAVPAVADEGGLIERFAGDAILVLFNALGDQPDHAARAARAALAIVRRSDERRAGHVDWPRFRIGIEAGTVVVGNVGAAAHRTFSAIGDAINVASRLQMIAPPGRVAVGPGAWAMIEDLAEAELLGAVDLKGKASRVETRLLVSIGR